MYSYVPINALAYYAAHAGAISGMAIPGWIIDPAKADYAQVVGIAAAFAQAFDQAWNSTAQLSVFEGEAITAVVSSDFQQRGPGPLSYAKYSNPSNWTIAAAACVALILECDASFASQGMTPPPYPTSGLLSTAYAQSMNVVLPYGATGNTVVVTVPNVLVPPNCKVICTFDGVAQAPTGTFFNMGYSIGRAGANDTQLRQMSVTSNNDYDLAESRSFSYTYEYTPNQAVGNAVSFEGLAILLAEASGTVNMTITYASLLVEVVTL
jgi:hypothetical protein